MLSAFGLLLAQEAWRDASVVRSVAERFGITPAAMAARVEV